MSGKDHGADVAWQDGVPVARRFDDPYYSLQDGLAETEHVFLHGNDLPARWRDGLHIAELGFGTGLGFLTALRASPVPFHFTSFEAFPLPPADMARALAAFEALDPAPLLSVWTGRGGTWQIGQATLTVIEGDARETLPRWQGRADAWFLDGFSPAKNPELWGSELMHQVARHTKPGGSFATYTAAGHVRRALAEAGFTVRREPGYGRKRHMSVGVLGDENAAESNQ